MKKPVVIEEGDRKITITNISFAGEDLHDYSSQSGQGKTNNPGIIAKILTFKRGLKHLPKLLLKFTPTPEDIQIKKISTKMLMEIGSRVHAKTIRINQEITERNKQIGRFFATDFQSWIAIAYPAAAVIGEADNYYDGFIRNNIIAFKEYFDDLETEYGPGWFQSIVEAWKAEDELSARHMRYEMHAGHWGKCKGCKECNRMQRDIKEQVELVKKLTTDFMELRKQ